MKQLGPLSIRNFRFLLSTKTSNKESVADVVVFIIIMIVYLLVFASMTYSLELHAVVGVRLFKRLPFVFD